MMKSIVLLAVAASVAGRVVRTVEPAADPFHPPSPTLARGGTDEAPARTGVAGEAAGRLTSGEVKVAVVDAKGHVPDMFRSASSKNFDSHLLTIEVEGGNGNTTVGWRDAAKRQLDFLHYLTDDDVVAVQDATFGVAGWVVGGRHDLMDAYLSFGKPIVAAAAPVGRGASEDGRVLDSVLDGGFYVGRVGAVRKHLETALALGGHVSNPGDIVVDNEQRFVASIDVGLAAGADGATRAEEDNGFPWGVGGGGHVLSRISGAKPAVVVVRGSTGGKQLPPHVCSFLKKAAMLGGLSRAASKQCGRYALVV